MNEMNEMNEMFEMNEMNEKEKLKFYPQWSYAKADVHKVI